MAIIGAILAQGVIRLHTRQKSIQAIQMNANP